MKASTRSRKAFDALKNSERLPLAALLLVVVGATVLIAYFGYRDHYHFTDESGTMIQARLVADGLPESIWSNTFPRGPERLTALMFVVTNWLASSTAGEFKLAHIAIALAFSLTAVPVYLLARGLKLSRWWSVFAALFAIVGPSSLFGVQLMDMALGYLSSVLLIYAMWRSVVTGGWKNDSFVLAALAFVALSRVGNGPIAAALPVAILVQAWRMRPVGISFASWLRGFPKLMIKRHAVLIIFGLVLVIAVATAGVGVLTGGEYGKGRLDSTIEIGMLWTNTRLLLSHLALSTAVVGIALGGPWIVRNCLLKTNAKNGAFAVLAAAIFVVFSYTYYASMNEDRYFLLLIPLFVVAATKVLAERKPSWPWLAGGSLLTIFLVSKYSDWAVSPVGYFLAPGSLYLQEWLEHHWAWLAVLIVVLGLGVAAVYGRSTRRKTLAVGAVVVAGLCIGYQLVGAVFIMNRWTTTAAGAGIRFEDQTVLDATLGQDIAVTGLISNPTKSQLVAFELDDLRFFNHSVDLYNGTVEVDARDGSVKLNGGKHEYLLTATGFRRYGFNTKITKLKVFPHYQLEEITAPLKATYVVNGDTLGRVAPGGKQIVTIFPPNATLQHPCVVGQVIAPDAQSQPIRYELSLDGHTVRTGSVSSVKPSKEVEIPLNPRSSSQILTISGESGTYADGGKGQPVMFDLAVRSC